LHCTHCKMPLQTLSGMFAENDRLRIRTLAAHNAAAPTNVEMQPVKRERGRQGKRVREGGAAAHTCLHSQYLTCTAYNNQHVVSGVQEVLICMHSINAQFICARSLTPPHIHKSHTYMQMQHQQVGSDLAFVSASESHLYLSAQPPFGLPPPPPVQTRFTGV